MESEIKIHKTFEYERFRFLNYNRKVGSNKSLLRSVGKLDLTPYAPIVVNPDMYIIDGQHRFLACKEKHLPVHYIIYEGDPEKAMIQFNTCLSSWRQEEWMQYYVGKGISTYVNMQKYMQKYKVGISNAILLFSNGKTNSKMFKEGKLVDCCDKKDEIATFLQDISEILPRSVCNFRPFVNAVLRYFINFNPDARNVNRLKRKIGAVGRYKNTEDYYNNICNLMAIR